MGSASTVLASSAVVFIVTAAIAAAPDGASQDRTLTPGQPTQARVWIENRGLTEAIPIQIEEIDPRALLHVQFSGVQQVQVAGTPTVQTRPAPQTQWQYQTVTIQPGADPAPALNAAGQQGWETTGHQLQSANGTVVVLKRPR